MLSPITGYVATATGPDAAFDPRAVGRIAGRIRRASADGRYQSQLAEAVEAGILRPIDGVMVRYRVTSPDADCLDGIVATVALDDPQSPLLDHEETIADESAMRRQGSTMAAEARPIVVFDEPGFDMPIFPNDSVVAETPTGHRHELAVVEPIPLQPRPLVIADGHHRHAVAVERFRASWSSDEPRGRDRILALVVPAGVGLRSGSFHRRFARIDDAREVSDRFVVTSIDRPALPLPGLIVLWPGVDRGMPLLLRLRDEFVGHLPAGHDASAAAIARSYLCPLLGVAEADARYEPTVRTAIEDLPPDGAAVLLGPAPLAAVAAAALGGSPLPPKAALFLPKPFRGAVIRLVD